MSAQWLWRCNSGGSANVYASPIDGIVGGVTAAKGLSGVDTAIAAGLGVGIGASLYVGGLGVSAVVMHFLHGNKPQGSERKFEAVGTALVIPLVILMPVASGLVAHWVVTDPYHKVKDASALLGCALISFILIVIFLVGLVESFTQLLHWLS